MGEDFRGDRISDELELELEMDSELDIELPDNYLEEIVLVAMLIGVISERIIRDDCRLSLIILQN